MTPSELKSNVSTIVIMMMENRSFDHVFGCLRLPQFGNRADINGLTALDNPDYRNPRADGTLAWPNPVDDGPVAGDPPHERPDVTTQLAVSGITQRPTMTGFVRAWENKGGSADAMNVLTPSSIPVTTFLGQQYALCDNWFAALPTSTAPNRLMFLAGDTATDSTGLLADQTTVYDWLNVHGVNWRAYHCGLPFLTVMPTKWPLLLSGNFRTYASLAQDVQSESDQDWPQVIFVEPEYYDSYIHQVAPCDNHPPLAMAPGEDFIRRTYEALRSNATRWSRTALFLCYDEHGGFFDHVPPPAIPYVPPGGQFSPFSTMGVRVPAVAISPMAPQVVNHGLFDQTSLLQLLAERFTPGAAYNATVALRQSLGIQTASSLLVAGANRPAPAAPGVNVPPAQLLATMDLNPLQTAFAGATKRLANDPAMVRMFDKFPQLAPLRIPTH